MIERNKKYITYVEAEKPTWRNIWAILRGRHQPQLVMHRVLTTHGASEMMKENYTKPIRDYLNQASVFRFDSDKG